LEGISASEESGAFEESGPKELGRRGGEIRDGGVLLRSFRSFRGRGFSG
jgi:hypothetical protein